MTTNETHDQIENRPETVIEMYIERHGELMLDGDSFGLPYTGIDDLVDHLRDKGIIAKADDDD